MKKNLLSFLTTFFSSRGNPVFYRCIRFFLMILYPVFMICNLALTKITSLFDEEPEKEKLIPARPGDVICVHRIGFQHFAVYIGNDRIIHYDMDPSQDSKLCIHEASLKDFLNGTDIYYICSFPPLYGVPTENMEYSAFQKLMTNLERSDKLWDYLKAVNYHLYTPKETIERAKSRIGESDYNLITNNCEHFALWCKTGISESHQISGLLDALMMTDIKGQVFEMSAAMADEKITASHA